MKRTFYDAHVHRAGREQGGFMVGLEGEPIFDGTLPNADAARFVRNNADRYCFFRYVTKAAACSDEANREAGEVFLKFHPRRERYSPSEVIAAIRRLCPVAVMIDTLNEPYWQPYDYWTICRAFPDVAFVLPHAGCYLIRDFVKICHFQPNVWIDFSLTHTNFGPISRNPLPDVDELIDYALRSSFRNRILLGSDIPFFRQDEVVDYYERKNALDLLNGNFLRLFERLKDDCAKAQRGERHDND